MTSLSDAFPDHERSRFAADSLRIGAVIKAFVRDTTPPKEKRLIIIGESLQDQTVASIYINTRLNERVFPTPYLQSLNPRFEAAGRPFLDHDSHIDCTELQIHHKTHLVDLVREDPTCLLGELADNDLQHLVQLLRSANTIKPSTKRKYGLMS